MSSCCGDGNFCDFPWCECGGNAAFRKEHGLHTRSDEAQDCGNLGCNYCAQLIRKKNGSGVAPAAIDYVEWKRRYAARLMTHGWNERAAIKESEYVWASFEDAEDIPSPEDAADREKPADTDQEKHDDAELR